jgi:hypothetical protein
VVLVVVVVVVVVAALMVLVVGLVVVVVVVGDGYGCVESVTMVYHYGRKSPTPRYSGPNPASSVGVHVILLCCV